jgi:class 3 adenylate cyclase
VWSRAPLLDLDRVLNRHPDDGDVTTLQQVELGVLGPLQVRQYGLPVTIPGAKPRAVLTMLGLHGGSVVSADTLVELLWGDDPPRTAAKALQTHISSLRRALGDGFVMTQGMGWTLSTSEIDASRYKLAAKLGREAFASGDVSQAVTRFDEALALWRGIPELPDGARGVSEKTRWIEGHAALVEERADALLATGRAAEIIGELEAAIADAPLRERRWGHLMLALYRAGRQGDALGAYQRARSLLADELGVDPGPDLRRLEAAIVAQDDALEIPVSQHLSVVTRAVTFLLTDIEGSTAAWEADADAMAVALARHDEIVEQVVTSRGGRLIKTRGEGDATFSVFDRPSAAAAAAIELQEAIRHEPWALAEPMGIRVALHTGEVELRDGDYFGRAVNRAARLRSLAAGGQILCSGATAELVIDTLADDVVLADLGMRQLKNLARPEHVFELRLETTDDSATPTTDEPMERPSLPAVLAGPGPFVGRGHELERLLSAYQLTLEGGTGAVLIAGEPGVGKTRLAGEWSRQAFEQGAVVLYGRCDEDLGAPYQPFAEALRSLVPCLGTDRLRGLRGVEALLPLVPGLADSLLDLAAPPRADPDTERYALFDAVVAMLGVASESAPVVLILDDLHWAAKPTLLLLRHLLRFGEHARVQIVGTYRSTDLDRSHPLAAMLADLHRDGSASRLALSGLDEGDVTAYVAEAGYDDEELARALATVTGGNPFFLIEALRHVDESGGRWDPSTLPQGVREAVSRRLSRLPAETNKALAAAAVVGSHFALALVESVVGDDLIDAFDEASKAGIVIEEAGGRYRFNHAIVRQSLLAELASVRRMRLHQKIATTLETEPGADDELLAELAYHYFECAWAGNATKAVEYCRRAADQAMARLAYEGAADLYDKAVHALEEIDDELPDRDDQQAELLVARCEALLAAGDVVSARGAVSQLQEAAGASGRLAAWGTCFDGQLSMLTDPERLDEIESGLCAAAEKLAGLDDAAGEAKAHTVRAGCLARLGRIGDAETALDQALTAARRAREHRRVNAVLANAPLAALWGPNPVPRAGGRCLDVVRLLRITTGSPVVEATSTRCQGVLDAMRGRAAAGRALIDSARRTLTELGMRHALLEVDQFAGIVELVADDPASAEPNLRRACNGFRRMGLDADTAETAALLARTCLALDRDAEADELCTESERLAGHALKASIAWRTVRAQLLARSGAHDEAQRVAEEAVALAGRTDLLVDHGDACLALATVLDTAGDAAGARAAAGKALELYELKGAAALVDKARSLLGRDMVSVAPAPPDVPQVKLENECWRVAKRAMAAINREALDEAEQLWAPDLLLESRRKIVGFAKADFAPDEWYARRVLQVGGVRVSQVVIAIRGERLALTRTAIGTTDVSSGAPSDEFLRVFGIDREGRIVLEVWFDVEDIDAAMAELDAAYTRFEDQHPLRVPLENAASRVEDQSYALFGEGRPDEIGALLSDDFFNEDRRRGLRRESNGRAAAIENIRAIAALGVNITNTHTALRGDRLCLSHILFERREAQPDAFNVETLELTEIDTNGMMVARVVFDSDDFEAASAELDARYVAGEAAAHAHTWSVIAGAYASILRHELPPTTPDWVNLDHRRGIGFAPGDMTAYLRSLFDHEQLISTYIEDIHRLNDLGAVFTQVVRARDRDFESERRVVEIMTVQGDLINRAEFFDEVDLDAALAKFGQLTRAATQLENAASRADDRMNTLFAERRWDDLSVLFADDVLLDDRRRGLRGESNDRATAMAAVWAIAELGVKNILTEILATRGERLVLSRARFVGRDQRPEAFHTELLRIVEIDSDERIAAVVDIDSDDVDAAFEELDSRYLAGEAAPSARVWQTAMDTLGEANRHEPGPIIRGLTYVDHRRVSFGSANFGRAVEELWALVPDARYRVTAVHALDARGTVASLVIQGTDSHGNELEWSRVVSLVPDEPRMDVYDEADLDAALARFDELNRPVPRLVNTASQVSERFLERFAVRDWDAIAAIFADDYFAEDRRPVVGAGIRHGRDLEIASIRAGADLGNTNLTSTVIATRGARLILTRTRHWGRDQAPDAFRVDVLGVVEIDAAERIVTRIVFDPDDIDAAFAELDARYLAGEAAEHSHTWSVIARAIAAFNRHELPEFIPDWVNIDHRRARWFAPGNLTAYIRATWDLAPDVNVSVESLHQLSNLGAVYSQVTSGTSQDGFDAEWREIVLATVEGDLINRIEIFDEADIDAALARFDELDRPAPRLENAASQIYQRFWTHFVARDWDALAEIMAADIATDDRRRVVNAGVQHGRDAQLANMRSLAEIGANVTSTVMATRGQRLILARICSLNRDLRHGEFDAEMFSIIEINGDNRIARGVLFDLDDIDAAFAELDARYIAGEAAAHAHTWSVITQAHDAFNRRELPAKPPDLVDHRPLVAIEAGDPTTNIREMWDFTPDLTIYIEAVHRLSDLGAIFTQVSHGTSQAGFDAEWRVVELVTIDGDLQSRGELFDEADLDAAFARFKQLSQPAPRLENEATKTYERCNAYFVARDWDAVAAILADDVTSDDRRRVVRAGVQHGRETVIETIRAIADLGMTNLETTIVASRGRNLALSRARYTGPDQETDAFRTDILQIVEIDADNRMVASIAFDPDDIDAALKELDTRYLAGEAAAHARTWSVIARTYATFNRRELPPTTPDWVNIDHRRATSFTPGDTTAYLRATWDVAPDINIYIEAVHRLSDVAGVITHVAHGTSQEGFNAEWREITVLTVDGDLLNRAEIFDEAEIDVALARFDELNRPASPRLVNAASQVVERFSACFSAHDWGALAEMLAADYSADDRRRVVNAGVRHGRGAEMENLRAVANLGFTPFTSAVIATRGEHLVLTRLAPSVRDRRETFHMEMFGVVEIDVENRLVATVVFDVDDIDAAFEELDARYLAGEAATHAHTWSVITQGQAAFNRRELPTKAPDFVDHRPLVTLEAGDPTAMIRDIWDLTPDLRAYIEAVHRLSDLGAVFTQASRGTSQAGFDAEWRVVDILTVDGDLVNRIEMFEEGDIDAALARFDELSRPMPRLENSASQVAVRFLARFAARDWAAMEELLANDIFTDDRRRIVGTSHRGRDVEIAHLRAVVDIGVTNMTSTAIATRGQRLVLGRARVSGRDQRPDAFHTEVLGVVEINTDGLVTAAVVFDPDDIDAAFEELDARYIAGEAADHANLWSYLARAYAAMNSYEVPPTAPEWVTVDHRKGGIAFGPGDVTGAILRSGWDIAPKQIIYVEVVHELSDRGAVISHVARGTTRDGFDAEWRMIALLSIDDGPMKRCELFDEADLDTALARFDELNRHVPRRLENMATRVTNRFNAYLAAPDWAAMAEMVADDMSNDDRRPLVGAGVRNGRDAEIANVRTLVDIGVTNATWFVIATRGERLALGRVRLSGRDQRPEAFHTEVLGIVEIDTDNRIAARVWFELDDVDPAFAELDARYLAGEVAEHGHIWSAVVEIFDVLSRREFPKPAEGFESIDHRRGAAFGRGDLFAYLRAAWHMTPESRRYIEEVHRVTEKGAVITAEVLGTSPEGFDAEWRIVLVLTIDGGLLSRCELFDEADLHTALERFAEISR